MKEELVPDKLVTGVSGEAFCLDIDGSRGVAEAIRGRVHPYCVACGLSNAEGLRLGFDLSEDGSVSGGFKLGRGYEGYRGVLHGGILSTILDESMANCLFFHGFVAVTADFHVQFRHPVVINEEAIVRAWITDSRSPVHCLQAEIEQDGERKTVARGRFVEQAERQDKGSDMVEERTTSVR